MLRPLPVLRLLLVLAWASSLPAAEWTGFRGPTGAGHSTATGLPAEFGPKKNVAWKVEIPGSGWSSPVVFRQRIYLTAAVPLDDTESQKNKGQSLRVLCLDAGDGKVLWNVEAFRQRSGRTHRKNTHASPTPLTDGKHLFVHFGTHGTACLTLDGKLVWKNAELDYSPVHGNGGSPVLVDGLLVVSCDGGDEAFVSALDQSTAEIRWKTGRPKVSDRRTFSFSTPLVIDVDGRRQLVSSGSGAVVAYEPKTGKEIWQVTYDGYSVVPRPVYGHGLIYVCTGWNSPRLLAIKPDGRGDVTDTHVAWSTQKAVPHTPSPLLVGGEIYLISDRGVLSCLDARTGQSHWTERVGGAHSASPVLADGKIYFQSEQGEATVIEPGLAYKELARNQFPGQRTLASYAIADGALFIRTGEFLYRIQKR